MNKMAKYLYLIILGVIGISCSNYSTELSYALHLSGNNRDELQKVLSHFSEQEKDTLKYNAAVFLIKNMPYHYSVSEEKRDNYDSIIYSAYPNITTFEVNALYNVLMRDSLTFDNRYIIKDIETISSEYLIHHIDFMFDIWRNTPWLEDVSSLDFFEYLLSYKNGYFRLNAKDYNIIKRCTKETIDAAVKFNFGLFDIKSQLTVKKNHVFYDRNDATQNDYTIPNTNVIKYTPDCQFNAIHMNSILRYSSIPCINDFSPFWPNRDLGHYWISVFEPNDKDSKLFYTVNNLYSKVYRETFSTNTVPKMEINGDNYIPILLKNPFIKDVTELYTTVLDVNLKLHNWAKGRVGYGYLAVFNKKQLNPIAWGNVHSTGEVVFPKIGYGTVNFPIYYNGSKDIFGGFPFIIKRNGKIHSYIPDKDKKNNIILKRKYPLDDYKASWARTKGAQLLLSNDKNFNEFTTVYSFPDNPNLCIINTNIKCDKKYRYAKIILPKPITISELMFKNVYDSLSYTISSTYYNDIDRKKSRLSDRNVLTNEYVRDWLRFDFGERVNITEFSWGAATDDNGINIGNEYELMYYDTTGWVSLGRQIAKSISLEYNNVPSNAIFWLKNHSNGKEERIFSIENGVQNFH